QRTAKLAELWRQLQRASLQRARSDQPQQRQNARARLELRHGRSERFECHADCYGWRALLDGAEEQGLCAKGRHGRIALEVLLQTFDWFNSLSTGAAWPGRRVWA